MKSCSIHFVPAAAGGWEAEEVDGLGGGAGKGEIGEGFAESGGEFEAVAGEPGADRDLGIIGVAVDDEMAVGGAGVEADGMATAVAEVGEAFADEGGDSAEVVGEFVAEDGLGPGDFQASGVFGEFDGRGVETGEAVELAFGAIEEECRLAIGEEVVSGVGVEPEGDFAFDDEGDPEIGEESAGPGTGGDDEAIGTMEACGSLDLDPLPDRFPVEDRGAIADFRTVAAGEFDVSSDGFLDVKKSGVGFEEDGVGIAEGEVGEAATGFLGRDSIKGEIVECCGGGSSFDDGGVGQACEEEADPFEEGGAGFVFEELPVAISPFEEGDVVGVFEVGFADDACFAMGTAESVGDFVLFETENASTAARGVGGGGGTEAADSQNDQIPV